MIGTHKNICGNLSHLRMTTRSILSEAKGTHREQQGTTNAESDVAVGTQFPPVLTAAHTADFVRA